MSENKSVTLKFGGSLTTLILFLFIGFKLSGIITWSWIWVFSPVWLPIALLIGLVLLTLLGALIIGTFKTITE